MKHDDVEFSSLSAYVDGELDPTEASRVAKMISSNESLARRVAQLAAMKASVAAMGSEVIVVTVPKRRTILFGPVFGTCFGAAVMAVTVIGLRPDAGSIDGDAALSQAAALHADWLSSESAGVAAPLAAATDPILDGLAAAGLSPVRFQPSLLINGQRASHTGFVGRQGCRLSLFRIESVGVPQGLALNISDRVAQASWSNGVTRTVMVARGMAEARFIEIAAFLSSTGGTEQVPTPERIARLENSRRPCIG
jgi:anti-sigma factor RsiW